MPHPLIKISVLGQTVSLTKLHLIFSQIQDVHIKVPPNRIREDHFVHPPRLASLVLLRHDDEGDENNKHRRTTTRNTLPHHNKNNSGIIDDVGSLVGLLLVGEACDMILL